MPWYEATAYVLAGFVVLFAFLIPWVVGVSYLLGEDPRNWD